MSPTITQQTTTPSIDVKKQPDLSQTNVSGPRGDLYRISTPKGSATVDLIQGDGQIIFADRQTIHLTGFVGPQTSRDLFAKALAQVHQQRSKTGIDLKDVKNIHVDNATREVYVNMGEGGKPALNLGSFGVKAPASTGWKGEGSPIAQDPVRELSPATIHRRTIGGSDATINLWQGDGAVEISGKPPVLLTGWVGPITNPDIIANAMESVDEAKKRGLVPADFAITHLNLDQKGEAIRVNPTSGVAQAYITDKEGRINPTPSNTASTPQAKPTESSPSYADPLELTPGREVKLTFQGKPATANLWQGEGRLTLPTGEFIRLLGWVNERTSQGTIQNALTAVEKSNEIPRLIIFDVKGNHRTVK